LHILALLYLPDHFYHIRSWMYTIFNLWLVHFCRGPLPWVSAFSDLNLGLIFFRWFTVLSLLPMTLSHCDHLVFLIPASVQTVLSLTLLKRAWAALF
jgi:hypothetical protein